MGNLKTKNLMRQSLLSPLIAVLLNLALAFVIYFLCRVTFLLVNYGAFAGNMSLAHLWEMFRGGMVFDASAIMYTNALYIVLMLLPLHIKETPVYHKACKWVFVVLNSLAIFMNLCDTVYFQYTSRRTTSTVFGEFSHENNLLGIFATELVNHWYLLLVAVVLVGGLWKLYVQHDLKRRKLFWWKYDLVQLGVLLLMAPLVVGGMRGGLAHAVRPITVSNANQYVDSPVEAAIVLNTPFSMLRTIGKNVFDVPQYFSSEQEMLSYYNPVHQPLAGAKPSKKNVVVIIVESLGKEYIGSLNKELDGGRYKGYTPFVDSLLTRSMTFQYTFANGRKSIDAMPSVLSSIPMFVEPFFLTPSSMNDLTGLAGELGKVGYYTAFFHGAQNGSMGFEAFARATGYHKYFGKTEYDADPNFGGEKDFDGMWAIWDEPFLQFMAKRLNGFKQPFMATVFTASSHHPFKVPQQYEATFKDEGGQPIHKCVRYTDMALREFFASAGRASWYKNTIFVIVADHTNQHSHPYYSTDQGLYSIPIIFYAPDGSLKAGVKPDVIAQQIDIMPTLLHLLGYNKPFIGFGCDLMNTPVRNTWAVNYNNGIYQYFKGDYMMQFDGTQVKAMYHFKSDVMLKRNLVGKVPEQHRMELELKAIIQQYMTRMTSNRLTINN